MIEHANTISHYKCLPVSICKTITHNYNKQHHMFTVT